jgi:hypothetical protein
MTRTSVLLESERTETNDYSCPDICDGATLSTQEHDEHTCCCYPYSVGSRISTHRSPRCTCSDHRLFCSVRQ